MAVKQWKPDLGAGDLAGACFFNTLFLTLAVADYSADLWTAAAATPSDRASRESFLVSYVMWRNEMPVMSGFLLVLLCFLPVVLVGILVGAVQGIFGWRKATLVRNGMDCAELAGISGIVYCIATRVMPVTATLLAECPSKSKASAACGDALADMTSVHLAMVLLNAVMFVAPIVKYRFGNAGALAEKQD